MAAGKDIKRQIAMAFVIAMEKFALLVPVEPIIGGVQVQDNPLWRAAMRIQAHRIT